MYNAAIIGISGYGEVHYLDLKNEVENGNARIVTATVINQEDEKEKCDWLRSQGAVIFSDYQEMLDAFKGKVDLCFIPTGTPLHAVMGIAAMRAGANLFVEKPVAATIQDVYEMRRVSEETGKFVAVGYQYLYQPEIQKIKKLLLDGGLGRLKILKCHAIAGRNSAYYSRNQWAGRIKLETGEWVLDSPYNNAQAHYLNLLCFFAGTEFSKAAEIHRVQSELYRANDIENTDTVCSRITSTEGVEMYFYATHACSWKHNPVLVIVGEKGSITIDIDEQKIFIQMNDGTRSIIKLTAYNKLRSNVLSALRRKLSGENAFVCGLDLAGSQTLCCNGIHESSAIHGISDCYKSVFPESDQVSRVEICDIENIIIRAFESAKLFSEIGVPWAKPGRLFSMDGYRCFAGGRC